MVVSTSETEPSTERTAKREPSQDARMHRTFFPAPGTSTTATHSVSRSSATRQTLSVQSSDPDTSRSDLKNKRLVTGALWPRRVTPEW